MKKKFRFRLAAVERVRSAKEQECLRALATAQAKYQDALAARQALYDDTNAALLRRDALASTAQPVLAYQLETEFIVGNKQRMVASDQALFRARKFVDKALKEVLLAKRAVKAIDTLREKDFNEFKIAVRKQEQKDMEEIYVSRSTRIAEEEESEWSESA